MAEQVNLTRPWMVAVWPGMGNVALNAGIYLLSKLDMNLIAEFDTGDLFDVDHVEVKDGVIQRGRRPRNRVFLWTDPEERHDLIVFLGEAQPPVGKYSFCRHIVRYAKEFGIERLFTFAAMATQMHPEHASRIFGAATDEDLVNELKRLELQLVEDGHISGLNGVLLGAAAEAGVRGTCLLGEMPHIFNQLPFPKASLGILEVFTTMSGIELDFTELAEQSKMMEKQLGEWLARVEQAYKHQEGEEGEEDEEGFTAEPTPEEEGLTSAQEERLEKLFNRALKDRSKAFELKQELDRLGVFKEYEDRFLDLFKKSG